MDFGAPDLVAGMSSRASAATQPPFRRVLPMTFDFFDRTTVGVTMLGRSFGNEGGYRQYNQIIEGDSMDITEICGDRWYRQGRESYVASQFGERITYNRFTTWDYKFNKASGGTGPSVVMDFDETLSVVHDPPTASISLYLFISGPTNARWAINRASSGEKPKFRSVGSVQLGAAAGLGYVRGWAAKWTKESREFRTHTTGGSAYFDSTGSPWETETSDGVNCASQWSVLSVNNGENLTNGAYAPHTDGFKIWVELETVRNDPAIYDERGKRGGINDVFRAGKAKAALSGLISSRIYSDEWGTFDPTDVYLRKIGWSCIEQVARVRGDGMMAKGLVGVSRKGVYRLTLVMAEPSLAGGALDIFETKEVTVSDVTGAIEFEFPPASPADEAAGRLGGLFVTKIEKETGDSWVELAVHPEAQEMVGSFDTPSGRPGEPLVLISARTRAGGRWGFPGFKNGEEDVASTWYRFRTHSLNAIAKSVEE